jgi:protein required for attachment to host cells
VELSKLTWILVARSDEASIFESRGRGKALTLVDHIEHPRGRLKAGELESDRPGRAFDRAGHGRHSLSTEESATDRVEHAWASELAGVLDRHRAQGAFEQLALIAPPHLLGRLRRALPAPTARTVVADLANDLSDPTEAELRERLADLLPL